MYMEMCHPIWVVTLSNTRCEMCTVITLMSSQYSNSNGSLWDLKVIWIKIFHWLLCFNSRPVNALHCFWSCTVRQLQPCKHILKVASLPLNILSGKTNSQTFEHDFLKYPIKAVCSVLFHRQQKWEVLVNLGGFILVHFIGPHIVMSGISLTSLAGSFLICEPDRNSCY